MKLNGEWIKFDEEQMKKPMEDGVYLCLCSNDDFTKNYIELLNYIPHEIMDDPERRMIEGIDGDILGKEFWMEEHPDSAGAFYEHGVNSVQEEGWCVDSTVTAYYSIPTHKAAYYVAKGLMESNSQKEQPV